ncbi:glutathione S-transferase [Apiospora hydei]|uniref:glutathione transferase n=1 Tax=Apiospora hydei TaxID=1337664 RepID=A0ABR1VW31_9PEZI
MSTTTLYWLVGDDITYADLAWATWNDWLDGVLSCDADKKLEGYPHVRAWHERMTSRPAWKAAIETRVRLMNEQRLDSKWHAEGDGVVLGV